MSDILEGKIIQLIQGNPARALIEVPLPDVEHVITRKYERVLIEFVDNRRLSDEQRKKARACIREISEWQGDIPDAVHMLMKIEFKVKHLKSLRRSIFSLSNCDMTTAREYITYLIDFMIRWGVPSRVPLYELCEDIRRYVYACALYKRCAVCGKKADPHHVDRVGMGRDRTDICHIGMDFLPLCRTHHREAHDHGDAELLQKYHLETVKIDRKIAKVFKLGGKPE